MGRIRELAGKLWREHASPQRLGAAVAVGILVGCTPFFGLHFWIGLGLAIALRLNKVAVLLGSQISIPPLAPFLGFASVQVGALLLSGETVDLTVDDFTLERVPHLLQHFLLNWVVGGLVVGAGLAAPGFLLTAAVVRRRRRRAEREGEEGARGEQGARGARGEEGAQGAQGEQEAWEARLEAATERFNATRRGHRFYARFKYRMDPLYRQVCELTADAETIVDLGTGLGMLPLVLALDAPPSRRIIGVDWDADKIRSGRQACAGLDAVQLVQADMHGYELPGEVDAVVLADVLHYWPLAEQQALLRRAARSLAPGGRLIIRETDRLARSWLTRLLEGIAVRTGWNKGPGLSYRSEPELRQELERLGLGCGSAPASSAVHKGNLLVWGMKPEAAR